MTVLNRAIPKSETLQARILSGSFILLSGSGLASALGLAYNISIARFLGPKGFGDATAVYTLLTLLSAVTLSFQLVSAKVVAQQRTTEAKYAAYRALHVGGWLCGLVAGSLLLAFHQGISDWLNLSDPVLVVLLAVGVAFYVPLGCRRGYLQGAYGFRRFATSLVLEGAVRLGGSLLLVLLGLGVRGVIAANSAAVAMAYFAIVPKAGLPLPNPLRLFHALREIGQALAFFSGQVLINNCDIILVKHFFLPGEAGLYAAVAMVGRVIYSFSQAIVNSMFPLVAGTREEERRDLKVIATSLLLVLTFGSAIALGLRFAPAVIWTTLFGSRFHIAGTYGLPYLLALYAITTVTYSLSAVIITFEMSYKISNGSWIQLVFSGVVIAGIWRFHSSLREVILVQLVLMLILLALVAVLFIVGLLADSSTKHPGGIFPPLRLIRRAPEDEVIAEFLKSDFRDPVFRNYWESLHELVARPNLQDAAENAKRRALFFVRNLALWDELPTDTQWYEVELRQEDMARVKVFPRAQWRSLSERSFAMSEVAEHMRTRQDAVDGDFALKISQIGDRLLQPDHGLGPVIVIGASEREPLTVLDGNHRLLAAMLASPHGIRRLRFLCGLSPRMMECCWYNTNVGTLFRYGRNVVRHVARRPKAELARLLQSAG
jgi:O-antigen/teichoic acid export membrane protein